ncbi:kinesin-like protein KIF24 [Erpetoichthys calabaricus]|uniref:kinesin-like protein KIF24 n=1 Tax=Erpetoichthys calabaricus TaxID=27687 RepID=UPI0022344873|nr:kinesin-like protein KIF24 [Erpetoichthys calabaricus]
MASCLYECLCEAGLQKYFTRFTNMGVKHPQELSRITMLDYPQLGIHDIKDCTRLFQLVQMIKALQADDGKRDPTRSRSNPCRQLDFSISPERNTVKSQGCFISSSFSSSSSSLASSSSSKKNKQNCRKTCHDQYSPSDSLESRPILKELAQDVNLNEHFPSRTCMMSPNVSNKVLHLKKLVHTTGYNYGVPHASPRKVKSHQNQCEDQMECQKIRVCIRKRPLGVQEVHRGETDIISTLDKKSVLIHEMKEAVDLTEYLLQHEFHFDEVFDETCTNQDVYMKTTFPLIQHVFKGGKATCFAYGQTGAGKTHTMIGTRQKPGLYALAARDIFQLLDRSQLCQKFHVYISFFEIYCGQLYDLLNRKKRLFAREDGNHVVQIVGLREEKVASADMLLEAISWGNQERSRGASGVNTDSSRSHGIIQIQIKDLARRVFGRISFIDLAGSERAADTRDPDKVTKMEGAEINQSLLALKECIRALDQEHTHTPFRQSKLTQVLKDSFIGNSKTCMIANVSPSHVSTEHTLNTLRYADRVKELKRGIKSSSVSSFKKSKVVRATSPKHCKNSCKERICNKKVKLRKENGITFPSQSYFQPTYNSFQSSNVVLSSTPKSSLPSKFCRSAKEAWMEHASPMKGKFRGEGHQDILSKQSDKDNSQNCIDLSVKNNDFKSSIDANPSVTIKEPHFHNQHLLPVWKQNILRKTNYDNGSVSSDHFFDSSVNSTIQLEERVHHLEMYHKNLQQPAILQQTLSYQPLEDLLALYRLENFGQTLDYFHDVGDMKKPYCQDQRFHYSKVNSQSRSNEMDFIEKNQIDINHTLCSNNPDQVDDNTSASLNLLRDEQVEILKIVAKTREQEKSIFGTCDWQNEECNIYVGEHNDNTGKEQCQYSSKPVYQKTLYTDAQHEYKEENDTGLKDMKFYPNQWLDETTWGCLVDDIHSHSEWSTEEEYNTDRSSESNKTADKLYFQEDNAISSEPNLNDLSDDQKRLNSILPETPEAHKEIPLFTHKKFINIPTLKTEVTKLDKSEEEFGPLIPAHGVKSSDTENSENIFDSLILEDSVSGNMAPLTVSLLDVERTDASDSIFQVAPICQNESISMNPFAAAKNSLEESREDCLLQSSNTETKNLKEHEAPHLALGNSSVTDSANNYSGTDNICGLQQEDLAIVISAGNFVTHDYCISKYPINLLPDHQGQHHQSCKETGNNQSTEKKDSIEIPNDINNLMSVATGNILDRVPEKIPPFSLSKKQEKAESKECVVLRRELEKPTDDCKRPNGNFTQLGEVNFPEVTRMDINEPKLNSQNFEVFTEELFLNGSFNFTVGHDLKTFCESKVTVMPLPPLQESVGIDEAMLGKQIDALGKVWRRLVEAHYEELDEMESLNQKEKALLLSLPEKDFAEYVHKLEEIMTLKAKCVQSLRAQLQLCLTCLGTCK